MYVINKGNKFHAPQRRDLLLVHVLFVTCSHIKHFLPPMMFSGITGFLLLYLFIGIYRRYSLSQHVEKLILSYGQKKLLKPAGISFSFV